MNISWTISYGMKYHEKVKLPKQQKSSAVNSNACVRKLPNIESAERSTIYCQ